MISKEQVIGGKVYFSCSHCGISLAVDQSLAGVSGPCPSCGQAIGAPHADLPQKVNVRPREFKIKERGERPVDSRVGDVSNRFQKRTGVRENLGRRRSVSPDTGVSEVHRERAEVTVVVKMLVAGLLVLGIMLGVAFWLNQRLGN